MNIKVNKKMLISLIVVTLVIILIIFLRFINKKGVFINLVENFSNKVIDFLDNDTLSGNFELDSNVNSYYMGNTIISKMNSSFDYKVDFNKGIILVNNDNTYNNLKLDTNVYISDKKINILADDVYDKYVSFDVDYLKLLDDLSDYRNVYQFIIDDLEYYLKNKYFDLSTDKISGKKVDKMTLDLTGDNYREFEKKFTSKISKNKKLQKSLKNIEKNGPFRQSPYVDLEKYPGFKLSIYTYKNDLLKVEFHDETNNKIIVTFRKNKVLFKIYIYDALYYDGSIELKNSNSASNKAIVLKLSNVVDDFHLKFKFSKLELDFNEKFKLDNNVHVKDSINYLDLSDDVKDKMKNNKIIGEIYNNYSKREYEGTIEESPELPDVHPDEGVNDA